MMDDAALKLKLKKMVIEECALSVAPEDIADAIDLFAPESGLDLDSIDALQISMGLWKHFGLRIGDPKEFRRLASTIDKMAACLRAS
ncbi:MAG: acyl carrier protein [Desulfobulbaceae bacterium]|jgi:acyl carrier protein|nr:acyl carrier protein [Desulfobulbaceae bacterium]